MRHDLFIHDHLSQAGSAQHGVLLAGELAAATIAQAQASLAPYLEEMGLELKDGGELGPLSAQRHGIDSPATMPASLNVTTLSEATTITDADSELSLIFVPLMDELKVVWGVFAQASDSTWSAPLGLRAPVEAWVKLVDDAWLEELLLDEAKHGGDFGQLVAAGAAMRLWSLDHIPAAQRDALKRGRRPELELEATGWLFELDRPTRVRLKALLQAHVLDWEERFDELDAISDLLEINLYDLEKMVKEIAIERERLQCAALALGEETGRLADLDERALELVERLPRDFSLHYSDELVNIQDRTLEHWWGQLTNRQLELELDLEDEDLAPVISLAEVLAARGVKVPEVELDRVNALGEREPNTIPAYEEVFAAAAQEDAAMYHVLRWGGEQGWVATLDLDLPLKRKHDDEKVILELSSLPASAVALLLGTQWFELSRDGESRAHVELTMGQLRKNDHSGLILVVQKASREDHTLLIGHRIIEGPHD